MRSSISYYFSLGFTSQAFCKILRVLLKLKVNCPRQRRAPGHSQSQAHTRQTENRGESNETFVSLVVHWPSAHKHKFGQNNAGKLPALWWVTLTRWLGACDECLEQCQMSCAGWGVWRAARGETTVSHFHCFRGARPLVQAMLYRTPQTEYTKK